MNKAITLIQPRHSYAPDTGIGHIYMPNSLMTIGAQMHEAGYDVDLYDLNIEKAELKSNIVGINLLAGSHISEVQSIISAIRQGYGNDIKVVLGGQILAPGRDIKHPKAPV
ncbi:cobalamin-dependent protein [Patescibacteria group bacterium]|nr:cobalamin-dependent protein [Patescibacteria group bacterium]